MKITENTVVVEQIVPGAGTRIVIGEYGQGENTYVSLNNARIAYDGVLKEFIHQWEIENAFRGNMLSGEIKRITLFNLSAIQLVRLTEVQ